MRLQVQACKRLWMGTVPEKGQLSMLYMFVSSVEGKSPHSMTEYSPHHATPDVSNVVKFFKHA